jgi:hypothetical protein
MAGNVLGLHLFGPDTGPEPLSLLDGNYGALTTALNTLTNFTNNYLDSGAVNALVVTVPAPQVFAYSDGVVLNVKVAATTTIGAPTINVNGLGLRTLVNTDGSGLATGQLVGGGWAVLEYEATSGKFMVIGGGSGGSLGTGLFANGSATNPSIAFTNSTGTGLYRAGADILGIATAGVQRATVSAAGNVVVNSPSSGAPITINGTSGGGGFLNALSNTNGAITADFTNSNAGSSATAYLRLVNNTNDLVELGISSTGFTGPFFNNGPSGEQVFLGSGAAIPISIGTNNTERIRIAGAGNITINAPGSGVTQALSVLDGGTGLSVNSTTSSLGYFQTWSSNGSIKGYIGLGSITFSGASINDFGIASAGVLRLSSDAGSHTQMTVSGTTGATIQGLGPVAAALVDMTPDQGSWTATFSGAISTTGTMKWRRIGSLIIVYTDAIIAATSSSASTITFNSIPAAITPATQRTTFCNVLNGGSDAAGSVRILTNNTATLFNANFGVFSNGTNCGLTAGACMSYTL